MEDEMKLNKYFRALSRSNARLPRITARLLYSIRSTIYSEFVLHLGYNSV